MKGYLEFITENEENREPTSLIHSRHSTEDVDRVWQLSHRKAKVERVHKLDLRATQHWVDKRYEEGKTYPNSSANSKHPKGIRDKHGKVHLLDGHHRAHHADGPYVNVEVKRGDIAK